MSELHRIYGSDVQTERPARKTSNRAEKRIPSEERLETEVKTKRKIEANLVMSFDFLHPNAVFGVTESAPISKL